MPLDITKEIDLLRQIPVIGKYLRSAFQRVQDGLNSVGNHMGVDPTGTLPAPQPVNAVSVASDGGNLVHVTITDNSETQKNSKYFIEWADNNGYLNSHVEDLGASRGRVLNMPQGTFYVRAYNQLPGSLPGEKINHGGTEPTPIVINSGSTLSLLPSTGSGTAPTDGSRPGQGLGVDLIRRPTIAKRTSG